MKSSRWVRGGDTLDESGPDRGKPAQQRRLFAQDRLVALGAGGDETEGYTLQLLEPLDIAARLRRQVGLVPGADGRGAPALDLLVDGLGRGHDGLVLGELREDLATVPVGDADLHRLALVEHVELREGHGVEPVDPHCVASDDRVEPAAASRPPGGGAVFVAARANRDRKSTRLNSSHTVISYAVFCLK